MRVLLDECVKASFPDHEGQTVTGMGRGGITNGKLMALAQQSRLQQHRAVHGPCSVGCGAGVGESDC